MYILFFILAIIIVVEFIGIVFVYKNVAYIQSYIQFDFSENISRQEE